MARSGDPLARGRLVEAAAEVFAENGLDRSKVAEIALRAGLSKGAFYLHFESKDEAFREVVQAVLSHLERFLSEDACGLLRERRPSAAQVLDTWLQVDQRIFEYVWDNRALVRLTLEGGGSADYRHLVDHFAERVQKHIHEMLRMGVDAGMYRSGLNFEATAAFIAGGYDRCARQLVRHSVKPDIGQIVRELQELVILGVGSPGLIECLERLRRSRRAPGTNPDPG